MSQYSTLIHTAMLCEALPIIQYFKLKEQQNKPFKLYSGNSILLAVSGIGRQAAGRVIKSCLQNHSVERAINIGIAGCNNPQISIGAVYSVYGGPEHLPAMPLITVDQPVDYLPQHQSTLVDMEGSEFVKTLCGVIKNQDIHVIKVVSDHLKTAIPEKQFVSKLIAESIPHWEVIANPAIEKINKALKDSPYHSLKESERISILDAAKYWKFSYQQIKQIAEMACDFNAWDEGNMADRLQQHRQSRDEVFLSIRNEWEELKNKTKTYKGFQSDYKPYAAEKKTFQGQQQYTWIWPLSCCIS